MSSSVNQPTQPLKPPRTLGVSLAIVLSVFLFTILPLTQLVVLRVLQYRASSVQLGGAGSEPIAVGVNFGGETNTFLGIQAVLGVIYLIVAVFAWRGRPQSIRLLVVIAVLVLTLFNVWDSLRALFTPPDLTTGLDSGGGLRSALQCARLIGVLLVPLYTLWYLNRGPARAFFRGYYLPDPADTPANDPSNSP